MPDNDDRMSNVVLQYYNFNSTLPTLAVLAVFVVSVSSIFSIAVLSVLAYHYCTEKRLTPLGPRAGHIDRFYGETFTADTDLHCVTYTYNALHIYIFKYMRHT